MAFGTDALLIFALGILLLGPTRLAGSLARFVRAKAHFGNAMRSFGSWLDANLNSQACDPEKTSLRD